MMLTATPIHEILEWIAFLFIFITFLISIYVIKKIGFGTLKIPIINFAVGAVIIGSSQLFYLTNLHHDHTSVSVHVLWHLIFYLGIIAFVWGARRLKQISNNPLAGLGKKRDIIIPASLVSLATIIWLLSETLKQPLQEILMGSIFESFGLQHYLVLIFASITALYVIGVDDTMKRMLGINVYPILFFLYLISLQHFLVGIFGVLIIPSLPAEILDTTTQLIPLLAFIILDYGFLQLASRLKQKGPVRV